MDVFDKCPRPEYPRPDFEREKWINLNGWWEFCFDDKDEGVRLKWFAGRRLEQQIVVPFCYQSEASGIGLGYEKHEIMWYAKDFRIPGDFHAQRILLNFGAVDYDACVWVDGSFVGGHRGGYTPFSIDITDALSGEEVHRLYVRVKDPYSCVQPRGKQNWEDQPFGCWYTPISGIWQTVWMEPVNETHLKRIRITPDIDNCKVDFEILLNKPLEEGSMDISVHMSGIEDSSHMRCAKSVKHSDIIKITLDMIEKNQVDNLHFWSPESPFLYDTVLTLTQKGNIVDRVSSYFGMRKIDICKGKIRLNNSPYYQKLILDQGYWRESLLTPPSDEAIIKDIEMTKAMGFNGARKHQKIEDPRYYYWADKLGLLVWGEVPSAYQFCTAEMENLFETSVEFIKRDYNHPCIVIWVPLNESWGVRNICAEAEQQRFANGLYKMFKALDTTRLVSGNDGWEQVDSDICAIHDYTAWSRELHPNYDNIHAIASANGKRMLYTDGYEYQDKPVLITEYGGIAFAQDSGDGNWGYSGTVETTADFLYRYGDITTGFRALTYVQGYCYTQLTDVFEEVNGLLDMNRVPKIDLHEIKKINE